MIETEQAFKASFEKVYGLLTDQDFLRKKYEGVGSRNVEFGECGQDEEIFRIEWSREVPSNPPGFAKKFLSEWNRLEEIMEWTLEDDGSARADYLCHVAGVPGKLEGEFELRPDGKGCVESIVMKATISVPLLGHKVAGFVEDDAEAQLEKEYRFTKSHLKEK